jgi:predicted nucleic acid-binding protein
LLDVNVLVARFSQTHKHSQLVTAWFSTPDLRFAICAFTESGFLRIATGPLPGRINMPEATAILHQLTLHPGYRYLPITADWQTLCSPFFKRLYGTNQVTDAYLLGLAVREDLVLVTMDKGILHLAGPEHRDHVLLLETK